jgi:pSer/pThr/pTyr-binding forkhead associated (FHA) protein
MNDKQTILTLLVPKAALKALTPEAERAVPDGMMVAGLISISHFPFRIGRESRGAIVDGDFVRTERPRFGDRKPKNDLYLIDAVEPLEISREHLQIESTAQGYVLVDRGSACGTSVGELRIGGGDAGGSAPLKDGDTIAIGTEATPYRYTFILL